MRNKRKIKETNRHIKKYNRVKIFGGIIYWLCMVAVFSYWIYLFLLWIFYNDEQIAQFPLTATWISITISALPLISAVEYFYQELLGKRAKNVLNHRDERIDFYNRRYK